MLSRAKSVGGALWDRERDHDIPVALCIQILHLLRDAVGGYRAPDPWSRFLSAVSTTLTQASDGGSSLLAFATSIRRRDQLLGIGRLELMMRTPISVATGVGQPVRWTATGDVCPGDLNVVSGARHILLIDTSCSLRALVGAFLPKGKAMATRAELKACGSRL
jgi:hypothetical protein